MPSTDNPQHRTASASQNFISPCLIADVLLTTLAANLTTIPAEVPRFSGSSERVVVVPRCTTICPSAVNRGIVTSKQTTATLRDAMFKSLRKERRAHTRGGIYERNLNVSVEKHAGCQS